ncbi:hypothetical protein K4K49_000112 [Colletotrichum sp. SAR 10_70]|nr:hypothetical protein K4K50_009502 [Colletotrichum sp. SAR 10_71]KAI8191849.1 hypothetical protein K4K51_010017 [Colletotrichum sp. SAR 10_75]KAI8204875.1 hypothetical protein K4K49_000112 [Colletotrichum sp. SAR 10_70]KAI8228889.1 hypothetical protein K4K54_001913 [Colletotrichum sp. SAR 10_86]KAI8264317.1 hypothetical protein K4K53_003607 [Colletotrichum sp. SAR 10_77]KAJ5006323.1 hypothetical protein K4K48_004145 [Colletotrichum sp. SAR 10_66]
MHAKVFLMLGFAAASAIGASVKMPRSNGYKISDLGDGVFTASFGEDGLVNVTRINTIRATTDEASQVGPTRRDMPITRFGCYSASVNHGDWENARTNFKNFCDGGATIPGDGLHGGEFDEFLGYINGKCGGWNGGWVDMDRWAKQYGMQQKGEAICGKANRVQW